MTFNSMKPSNYSAQLGSKLNPTQTKLGLSSFIPYNLSRKILHCRGENHRFFSKIKTSASENIGFYHS